MTNPDVEVVRTFEKDLPHLLDTVEQLTSHIENLEQEVERLREALRRIASLETHRASGDIARQALEEKPGGEAVAKTSP